MLKALPASVLLIMLMIGLVWGVTKVIVWAPRWGRERRVATADKHATWHPYRRVNKNGLWEIGCERRWKKTVLQTLPQGPALPLDTDIDVLLRMEGDAINDAGKLNNETL